MGVVFQLLGVVFQLSGVVFQFLGVGANQPMKVIVNAKCFFPSLRVLRARKEKVNSKAAQN